MKRIIDSISILALTVCISGFVACAPEIKPEEQEVPETEVVPEGMKKMRFTAAFSDLTKASIVGTNVRFSSTDSIAVYDGTGKNIFKVSSIDGGIAYFEGYVNADSDRYYAVYPCAMGSDAQPVDGTFSILFPSEQRVSANMSMDMTALSAIAEADKVCHFQFRNISSVVTVAIPDGAKKVTIQTNSGEAISGTCKARPGEMPEGASETRITLVPEEGSSTFKAGNYNICTLPAHLSNGYTLTYEDDYQKESVNVDASIEFSRTSQIDITSAINGMTWIRNFIHDADGLREFATYASGYSTGDIVGLAADIDLSDSEWTPFDLNCTLDGKGHKISGIKVSSDKTRCGFIGILNEGAVLKDLVLGSADGLTYDGISYVDYTGTAAAYQGLVSECFGSITGVRSFVSMKHSGTDPGMRLGGLVGCIRSNGKMSDCEFAGSIAVNAATASANHFVGGLVGRMHQTLADETTISESIFSGDITIGSDRVQGTGGIVGIMQGGNVAGCRSEGTVKINAVYANDSHYGGIAAYIQTGDSQNTATISDCVNATELAASAYLCSVGGIVGDIHNYSKLIKIERCTNDAEITVSVAPIAQSYLSGIVGFVRDGSTYPHEIVSCVNNGKITYSNTMTAKCDYQIFTAGIIGFSKNTSGVAVRDCINNGIITSNLPAVNSVAGIAGYLNKTSKVAGCVNNSPITLNPPASIQLGWQGGVAGIAAYLSGACTIEDCRNLAEVNMDINSSSPSHAAGGIAALIDADGTVLRSNENRGNVNFTTTNKQAAVGGILGITKSTTTLERNSNYGNVSFNKPGETGDCFAGGLIGKIDCGAAAKKISLTEDKSLGAISSPFRAAVLFSVIAWNATPAVTLTMNGCGLGGSVNGTEVTADNYGNYLWSWIPSSGCTITGAGTCKFVNE